MNSLSKSGVSRAPVSNRQLIAGLQKALEKKYSRVLQMAGAEWDRRFAAGDPSDACVRVRISAFGSNLPAPGFHCRPLLRH